MATILTEPFDNLTAWTLGSGGSILSGGQVGNFARIGGSNSQGWPYPSPSISNYVELSFWWRVTAIGTSIRPIVFIRSDTAGTNEITLTTNAGLGNVLTITQGGTNNTVLGNSGSFIPSINTWYRLHLIVFMATAAGGGFASLDVDGTNRINVTAAKTFLTTAQAASLWITGAGSGTNQDYDELVLVNSPTVTAAGTGAMAFAGSATAVVLVPAVASGSGAIAFDGAATAQVLTPAVASGAGAVAFDGKATATVGTPSPPACIFTPPVENYVPPVPANEDGSHNPAWRLHQFYPPTARGVNVFKLSDGTYPRDDVTGVWPTTDVVPNDALSSSWGAGSDSPIITPIDPAVLYVYYGGHTYVIDEAEADRLIAAGYGDCVDCDRQLGDGDFGSGRFGGF